MDHFELNEKLVDSVVVCKSPHNSNNNVFESAVVCEINQCDVKEINCKDSKLCEQSEVTTYQGKHGSVTNNQVSRDTIIQQSKENFKICTKPHPCWTPFEENLIHVSSPSQKNKDHRILNCCKSKPKKYVFPRQDPAPLLNIPEISSKEAFLNLINLVHHRLDESTYRLWCDTAERDVCYPEISKTGVVASTYTIKAERDKFKKAKNRRKAAQSCSDMNVSAHDPHTSLDLPTLDLLCRQVKDSSHEEFKLSIDKFLQKDPSKVTKKLAQRILTKAEETPGVWSNKLMSLCKNLINKFARAVNIPSPKILKCNAISLPAESVYELPLVQGWLRCKSTGSTENEIFPMMLDTGSEISLLGLEKFLQIGGKEETLDKKSRFSISSSTELKEDCIEGIAKLNLFVALKSKKSSNEIKFGKVVIDFYVASPSLNLKNKILLGCDFIHKTKAVVYSNGRSFGITAKLESEFGSTQRERIQPLNWSTNIKATSTGLSENDTLLFHSNHNILVQANQVSLQKNNHIANTEKTRISPNYKFTLNNEWPILHGANKFIWHDIDLKTTKAKQAGQNFDLNFNLRAPIINNLFEAPARPKAKLQVVEHLAHRELDKVCFTVCSNQAVVQSAVFKSQEDEVASRNKSTVEGVRIKEASPWRVARKASDPESHHGPESIKKLNLIICAACQNPQHGCICSKPCSKCLLNQCSCPDKCISCGKTFNSCDNFLFLKTDTCKCDVEQVKVLKTEIQQFTQDCIEEGEQSDMEKILEDRLEEFNLDLEQPEFEDKNQEIDLSNITSSEVKVALRLLLTKYSESFSKSKFDVGMCSMINTRIPLINDTCKAWENERILDKKDTEKVQSLITELLQYGIIERADQTSRFVSNILVVAKPSDGQDPSKAGDALRKLKGESRESTRVVVDLRKVNRCTIPLPPPSLSSYKELEKEFADCYVSTYDLAGFFYALPLSFESQEATNFWFNGTIYKFVRTVMGARNSSTFAIQAGNMIFSDKHLQEWADTFSIQLGSEKFPYTSTKSFVKIYLDDIVSFSNKELGEKCHLLCIHFVLFCVEIGGVKLARKKCKLFCTIFTYLGHEFLTESNETRIPDRKRILFKDFRRPRSTAEILSRLGAVKYFESKLPLLAVVSLPLWKMAHGEEGFYWNDNLEMAWETVKLLCELQMTNAAVNPDKTLYIATDASQIATAYMAFQISENAEIVMVYTTTRLLIRASRNKSSAFRELLAIVSGVSDLEHIIRQHRSEVVVMSDSISLSLLTRQKYSNNRLMEIALYLSSFGNLSVLYLPGSAQFMSDALSRQFDRVFLANTGSNISQYFAELLPPVNRKNIGQKLSPEQLKDLLLNHSYNEKIDVFCKRSYYAMNSHRYMNVKELANPRKIPVELDFLAHCWLGLNSPDLTPTQLNELTGQINDFPSIALKQANVAPNLVGLRNKLLSLKDRNIFMEILKAKYFPKNKLEKCIDVGEQLSHLNAPEELKDKVTRCLQNTQNIKSKQSNMTKAGPVEAPVGKHLSEDSNPASQGDEFTESDFDQLLSGQGSLQRFAIPIIRAVLKCFLNRSDSDAWNTKSLAECLNISEHCLADIALGKNSKLPFSEIMRLLACISWAADNSSIFRGNSKFSMPFNNGNFTLQFSDNGRSFDLILKESVGIDPFGDFVIKADISLYVAQYISFVPNDNSDLIVSCLDSLPPWHYIENMFLQNTTSSALTLQAGYTIGKFEILALSESTQFIPVFKSKQFMNKIQNVRNLNENRQQHHMLVEKLASCLDKLQPSNLPASEAKHKVAFLTELAGINQTTLPKSKRGYVNNNMVINNLNKLLFQQHLARSNSRILSATKLKEIQVTEPLFSSKFADLVDGKQDPCFEVHKGILYKTEDIYGEKAFKLCVPSFMAQDMLRQAHYKDEKHCSAKALVDMFATMYFTPGLDKKAQDCVKSCVSCRLAPLGYRRKITGSTRTLSGNETPGRNFCLDVAYLPLTERGFKFCAVVVETVTSFVSAIPLKQLNAQSLAAAIRLFFGIMGFTCESMASDFGPEFSSVFTEQLNMMGIEHTSRIPQRSQSQGAAELAVKLLKQTITKIAASKLGSKQWDLFLPLAVCTINNTNPYGSPLSRLRLLFSPFIYTEQALMLENPVHTQFKSFEQLAQRRINALTGKNQLKHTQLTAVKNLRVGSFCTVDANQGNKSINIMPSVDLYKITAFSPDRMSVTVHNIRTGSYQSLSPDRLQLLRPSDLVSLHNNTNCWEILAKSNRLQRGSYIGGNNFNSHKFLSPVENDMVKELSQQQEVQDIGLEREGDERRQLHAVREAHTGGQHEADENAHQPEIIFKAEGEDPETQSEESPAKRYNLRPRVRASLSLLKVPRQIKMGDSLSVSDMQAIVCRSAYKAFRVALNLHSESCQEGANACGVCKFNKIALNFSYNASNTKNTELPALKQSAKSPSKVHFAPDTIFHQQQNMSSFNINLCTIEKAAFFSSSLRELCY